MTKTFQITLKCAACGSTNFEDSDGFKLEKCSKIKCTRCGRVNNYNDLMKHVNKEAEKIAVKEAEKLIKNIFK